MRKSITSYLRWILRIAESSKMSKEERVIKNLEIYMRQHNGQIAGISFLLVLMVSASAYVFEREHKLNKMIAPSQIRRMATFCLEMLLPAIHPRSFNNQCRHSLRRETIPVITHSTAYDLQIILSRCFIRIEYIRPTCLRKM